MVETTLRKPTSGFSPVIRHLLVLVLVLFTAIALGCDDKKKSSGGGGGEGGGESSASSGGGGGGEYEHVGPGERKQENETQKAERVMRQLGNYMLGIASAEGAPEDLEAAKAALKKSNGLNWMKDPWGNPYNYEKTGDSTFRIFTSGPDGQPGTADDIEAQL